MRASDKFLRGLLIGVRDRIQVQSRYSLFTRVRGRGILRSSRAGTLYEGLALSCLRPTRWG
jgi:hypothetical protein